jgi:hypothetical protein
MTGYMVDAGPARDRVKELVADGMRQQSIADRAGVSNSAVGILLHGHYTPGRPAQQTINVEVEARIMRVRFEAPEPKREPAVRRCTPDTRFELAGYRVGRCDDCGELAPLRVADGPDGYRQVLVGHPARDLQTAVSS